VGPIKARKYLDGLPDVECSCDRCRTMCRRPCWPSPAEVRVLIDKGYAPKLMLDWWIGPPDIYLICPANPGRGGKPAPRGPDMLAFLFGGASELTSGCIMQSKSGKCKIHKLKPIEGRKAMHVAERSASDRTHEAVAMLWKTKEGRDTVKLWKETVGYKED
jgi:hypothetical protein